MPDRPLIDDPQEADTEAGLPAEATSPDRGVAASAAAAAAGARRTAEALRTADAAKTVAGVITDVAGAGRVPAGGRDMSAFLRDEAAGVRGKTGAVGRPKARDRLKGYLFEEMDTVAYNEAGRATGKRLERRTDPRAPAYDSSRFIADPETGQWKFAGGVQQKSSAHGVDAAVAKMEARKPGSASRGTVRVPGDELDETKRRLRGRARAAGSEVTSEQLNTTLDAGLDALAAQGGAATSRTRAAAKGAGKAGATSAALGGLIEARALRRGDVDAATYVKHRVQDAGEAAVASTVAGAAERIGAASVGGRAVAAGAARSAVVTVAVSSLRDVPAVARGDMSARDFSENRVVDAGEAAAVTIIGGAASTALLATVGGAATSAAISGAAAGAAASAAGIAAGTGTAAGTAIAGVLGTAGVAAAGPVIVGGAVVVGTGLVVSAGFKQVRRRVKAGQSGRRGATAAADGRASTPARIAAAETVVEVQLVLDD